MKMNIFTYLMENVLNVQPFRQTTSEIKLKIQKGKISQLKNPIATILKNCNEKITRIIKTCNTFVSSFTFIYIFLFISIITLYNSHCAANCFIIPYFIIPSRCYETKKRGRKVSVVTFIARFLRERTSC